MYLPSMLKDLYARETEKDITIYRLVEKPFWIRIIDHAQDLGCHVIQKPLTSYLILCSYNL